MKRKIFIVCVILIILILIFSCYKFLNFGNNKNIENIDEFCKYISGIKEYEAEAVVTVNSNKNSNTYNLKQRCKNGVNVQEITSKEEGIGIVIENYVDRTIIKNTNLGLEKVFDLYKEPFENALGLDSFVDDFTIDDRKEVIEENNYFVANIKINNSNNKYNKSKKLYFNKETNKIEKMEIKDINNNSRIIIEYTKVQFL